MLLFTSLNLCNQANKKHRQQRPGFQSHLIKRSLTRYIPRHAAHIRNPMRQIRRRRRTELPSSHVDRPRRGADTIPVCGGPFLGAEIRGPVVKVVHDADREVEHARIGRAGFEHTLQASEASLCGFLRGVVGSVLGELGEEVGGFFAHVVGVETALGEATDGGLDDVPGAECVLGCAGGVEEDWG